MKTKQGKIILIALAITAILGFTAYSFADGWGGGMHRGGGMHGGYGNCPRGDGPGYNAGLSDEEIAVIQKERQAFFDQTRELRDKIYQKHLELRSEIAKQNPDAKKAGEIQKDLFGLENELDRARLENQLKLKKENPKLFGRGFGMGMGMGKGHGAGCAGGGCGNGPCRQ
jgi:hypothetical protein